MSYSNLKPAAIMSNIIVLLMIVASGSGLLLDNLYRDNLLVSSGWRGNDLVTLLAAAPILATAVWRARHGSWKAYLVWMGMLDYALYNYGFYLFGAHFNNLFLIYTAIFTLSIFALILGLAACDIKQLAARTREGLPARWIAGWMGLIALFLGALWISESLRFVLNGRIPAIMHQVDFPTNVTGALDLSLVVSINALGAFWLWRRNPWGLVVAAIANVKGTVYMMALSATTIAAFRAGALSTLELTGLWGTLGVGCLVASVVLLSHVSPSEVATSRQLSASRHGSSSTTMTTNS